MSRFLLAASILAFALPAAAADKGKKGKGKVPEAIKKQDNVLVAELQQAYRVLDKADPIYNGHRGKALHEINAAIGNLQKEMHKHGMKQHHIKDGINLPDKVSHALVYETGLEVGTVLKQLSGLPSSPLRAKAVGHLGTAIKELELALAHVKYKAVAKAAKKPK